MKRTHDEEDHDYDHDYDHDDDNDDENNPGTKQNYHKDQATRLKAKRNSEEPETT